MSADPPRYVPRIAAESVLVRLQEYVEQEDEDEAIALLLGPPGIGKTLLLQVLQARLGASRRCVHVPHAAFGPDEICAWVLSLLREPAGEDPDQTLASLAKRLGAEDSGLVLLLDEAASLDPAAATRLSQLVREVHPAAKLVLAGVDEERTEAVRRALGRVLRVRFDEPLSPGECERHVRALLARDPRPAWRDAALDEAAIDRLYDASEGNPAVLEELVEQRAWEPGGNQGRSTPA